MTLADYLRARRWFRGKARRIAEATFEEGFPLQLAGERVTFAVVRCAYEDGGAERYVLPVAETAGAAPLDPVTPIIPDEAGAPIGYDALGSPRLLAALLDRFRDGGTRVPGSRGALAFRPLPGFEQAPGTTVVPRVAAKEQTNTSVVFGDRYILKVVRLLDEGRSAELEMGELLTRGGFAGTPPVLGAIEIERGAGAEPSTVGIVHRFLPNRGDAWSFTLEALAAPTPPSTSALAARIDAYLPHAALLGQRVGEMHAVLARATEPAFAPEPLARPHRERLATGVRAGLAVIRGHLRPGDDARIEERLAAFVDLDRDPLAMRVHGDLHLGQILATPDDFVIIDFEGEPARPLAERKARRSPMADVAGMLRSFDYAAGTALRPSSREAARAWREAVSAAFLAAYRRAAPDTGAGPAVLDFYLLEKCVYEIGYEANNRPDWIGLPLDGLADLLGAGG